MAEVSEELAMYWSKVKGRPETTQEDKELLRWIITTVTFITVSVSCWKEKETKNILQEDGLEKYVAKYERISTI